MPLIFSQPPVRLSQEPAHEITFMCRPNVGYYNFNVPKDRQAELIEDGMIKFRTNHPKLHIASVVVVPGHFADMVKVMIIANPPFESPPAC